MNDQPSDENAIRRELVAKFYPPTPILDKVPRKISEVVNEINPEGTPVKVADIVDQEIVIYKMTFFTNEYGNCARVLFTDKSGVMYNTLMGQEVLLKKLALVSDQLPLIAKIINVQGASFDYYDFAPD